MSIPFYIKGLHRIALAISLLVIVGSIFVAFPLTQKAEAAYDGANIIANGVFLNSASMSISDVQNFLVSKGSGLANKNFVLNCYASDSKERQQYTAVGAPCDQNVPASQIIYYASQIYGVNPRVIIATLQKEQSLITSPNPTEWQINQAMGYGCPTSGSCSDGSNFFYQVDNGVWALRYHYERAKGNLNWWSPSTSWVCGTEKAYYKPNLYPGQNVQFYDEDGVHYRTLFLSNAASSALYCYTPHTYNNPQGLYGLPIYGTTGRYYTGSYNFVYWFDAWFGSTQYEEAIFSYKSHLSNIGWTSATNNSGMTGSIGQNRPMEAFKITGEVEYTSYNFNTGWQPTINKGMISGTTGQSRSIQALKINPIGSLANKYDIYYRTHVSNIGWMGWTKNGAPSGVTGDNGKNIEAFEVLLSPKGLSSPGTSENSYQNINTVSYSPPLSLNITSHVGNVGWQPSVKDSMVTGTTEQSKRIEAIKIGLVNNTGLLGNITYSAHLAGMGWQDFVLGDNTMGTIGQSRQMEAVRIGLTEQLSDSYDVWYRGHSQSIGWVGWAKNGAPTGSVGAGLQLEALEIRLVPKDSISLPQQNNLYNPRNQFLPDSYSINYSVHVSNLGWIDNLKQNVIGGTTGQSKSMEALKFNSTNSLFGNLIVSCSVYIKNAGWMSDVSTGSVCGTVGQSKALEAVKLNIAGTAASHYDIYYKVHLSTLGWQDWVKNNEQAGTADSGKSIEAIIVKLVQK